MTAIVFETKGLIDIRAFTTMGISAKPATDSPIGQFGTGLKYAIAVLVRMGAEPKLWIGKDEYVFYKEATTFRDCEFDIVKMRMKRWPQRLFRIAELPFTTEYGKFWKPWQAFRELEANTRDEGGQTFAAPDGGVFFEKWPVSDRTRIIVDHPAFYEAWLKRDEIFLPQASTKIKEDEILEIFEGQSRCLYWRGMRVMELSKPSMFTYNILRPLELTEDRTVKYEFYVREALGDFVAKSENRDFMKRIVTAGPDTYESHIDFSSWRRPAPSPVFMALVREKPPGLLSQAQKHYEDFEPPEIRKTDSLAVAHPTPWRVVSDWIEDAEKRNIFQKPSGYRGDWSVVASKIVEMRNDYEVEACETTAGRSQDDGIRPSS